MILQPSWRTANAKVTHIHEKDANLDGNNALAI